ncbi:MAG TPA: trypsin-like peptidase domain-containing protein [Phycisphaerae bacterium]|nr:trypsin-like peptidase domain-containing protein [Phycisphaerae bacterium]
MPNVDSPNIPSTGHRLRPHRFAKLAIVAALLCPAALAMADDLYSIPDMKKLERTFERIAENVRPSVVSISTRRLFEMRRGGERMVPHSQGSGLVYRSNGYIITNHHVIEGADEITVVVSDGSRRNYDAHVVQFDPRSDLAVLKIDAQNLRVAPLSDLSEVRMGQWVFTMGNPFGLANDDGNTSVSFGTVGTMGRSLTGLISSENNDRYYGNLIQTDASINPGNSGGPLFDLEGRVVGVNTAMVSGSGVDEGLGFAIPISSRTRRIISELADGRVVRYGFLGVTIADPDLSDVRNRNVLRGRGALIRDLTGDASASPAARAGLKVGDVITEFDGQPVLDSDHLIRLVGETPIGRDIDVVYIRNRQQLAAKVQLAERVETVLARRSYGVPNEEYEMPKIEWRGAMLVEPTRSFIEAKGISPGDSGIYVLECTSDSKLHRSGLRNGDLIDRVDGKRVQTFRELSQFEAEASGKFTLELRNGKKITIRK